MRCKCVEVYDGDTITLILPIGNRGYKDRCRLNGIDTPEIRTKDAEEKVAGIEAKNWLSNHINGKMVWVIFDGRDKYGRLLGTVFNHLDDVKNYNLSYNSRLIAGGMAVPYDGGKKVSFMVK